MKSMKTLKLIHQQKISYMYMLNPFNVVMPYIIHCNNILRVVITDLKQWSESLSRF